MAGALKISIMRHVKDGWSWVPPYLEKDNVKKRPPMVMRAKVPGEKGYRWQDSLTARMYPQAKYLGNGRFRLGNLYMRHDASLLDERTCPECNEAPWFVKVPDTSGRTVPEQKFTWCRRCVTPADLEDFAYRQRTFAEEGIKIRARLQRSR